VNLALFLGVLVLFVLTYFLGRNGGLEDGRFGAMAEEARRKATAAFPPRMCEACGANPSHDFVGEPV
jgi:hypothetical protein